MDWLNYHHLLYFWMVAREGTIARAAKKLKLSQPTISGQLRLLERSLGERLFMRQGRNLVLTDVGRLAYSYADEIFSVGRELLAAVKGLPSGRPLRLHVGVADVVAKLIAYRLLRPALTLETPLHLSVVEDRVERLVSALTVHELDLVIGDAPYRPASTQRVFSHLLGESGVTVFGTPALHAAHHHGFPRSLDGAPFLMHAENTALGRALVTWFDSEGVRPRVVAEFEDSALLQTFGQAGEGLFVAPSVIEADVELQHGVRALGRAAGVKERFYAITVERRIKHPAVAAISEASKQELFP